MGYSWAFYFAQRIHVNACTLSGITPSQIAVENRPMPRMEDGPIVVPYGDNGNVASFDPDAAEAASKKIQEFFRRLIFGIQDVAGPDLALLLSRGRHQWRRRPLCAHS